MTFFGGKTVNNFNGLRRHGRSLHHHQDLDRLEDHARTTRIVPHHGRQEHQLGRHYAGPDGDGTSNTGYVQIIKFTPATTGTFTYVSQCSNRGLCNGDDALCECFKPTTTATRRAGLHASAAVLSRTRRPLHHHQDLDRPDDQLTTGLH